jgi:hypothetical protein
MVVGTWKHVGMWWERLLVLMVARKDRETVRERKRK